MNLKEIGKNIDLPWSYEIIGEVDDTEIKLVRYYGEYPIHRHNEDQFMLVVEGEVNMEIDGKTHNLKSMDFMKIPKGIWHRPIAKKSSLVIVIWKRDIKTEIK